MTVRRNVPYLLAALLGVGAALLAACGSNTEAGIPAAKADDLKSQIVDVRQAVEDGRCPDVPGQLRQVDDRIDDLPPSTDDGLVNNLRKGADRLREVAREECDTKTTETTPTQTTAPEPAEPEPTETAAPPTQTATAPPPTEASPPPPPQPPPPPEPAPEPAPQPGPPPGTPGGGVQPEVP